MAFKLRAASAAIFLCLSLAAGVAQTSKPSATTQGFHSRARLISGGPQGETWLAGIEITLDSGFKTYWRTPGDSGLPPRFDWSGSENLAAAEVRWPAPSRHEDAAGVAYVYAKKVVLPVLVTPKDKDKPVRLVLAAEYGVCKDICIPARADLSLVLSGEGSGRGAIEKAMAKVPLRQDLGAQADLSVLSAAPLSDGKAGFAVTVRAPAGTKPDLFAEGPENWYLSTSRPGPEKGLTPGTHLFNVSVEEKPKDTSRPVPLLLTLVAGDRAVETQVSLDGNGRPR